MMKITTDEQGWTNAGGSLSWRVAARGIETRDAEGITRVRRSKVLVYVPKTIYATHHRDIKIAADAFGLPKELLLTTAVVESAGITNNEKHEPHLKDTSIGICQTLTATASALCRLLGWPRLGDHEHVDEDVAPFLCPDLTLPQGGDIVEWRRFLGVPFNSFSLAAALYGYNSERYSTEDPIQLYAAYNAGSLRPGANKWGLAGATMALDSFANFYTLSMEAVRDYNGPE